VAEWSNALAWKASRPHKGLGSSNLPLSEAERSGRRTTALSRRARAGDIALIVAVAALCRAATFWTQVGDWDVGFYLIVAREVVHGHLPYVTAWEYRPPGLFVLLAAALAVFGSPGIAIAALGLICAGATSLALYAIGGCFRAHGRTIGLVAALLYATTSIEDGGLAGNTEIIFAPLLVWAIAIVVRRGVERMRMTARDVIVAGVLLGGALQMKLMVIPEAAFAIALAAVWTGSGVRVAASLAALTVLPFALEAIVYAWSNALGDLYDANVGATLRRVGLSTSAPSDNLRRILAQPLALAPASALALIAPFAAAREPRASSDRRLAIVLGLWLLVEALTIALVREFNDHQFLQLLPPLTLLAGYATARIASAPRAARALAIAVVLLSFGLHGYYQAVGAGRLAYHRSLLHDAGWRTANLDRIAAAIRAEPAQTRTLFVVGETPIVYALADAPIPTRLPFSLYLTDREMWPLTAVDGRVEVARILATRPTFIVRSDSRFHLDPAVDALVTGALRARYRPVQTFDHDVLYRLRAGVDEKTSMATFSSVPSARTLETSA
jgi:4-amino-4-deoxy-L-arabinose transferase-like glycosyltransferase